jgi:hypothetical protein
MAKGQKKLQLHFSFPPIQSAWMWISPRISSQACTRDLLFKKHPSWEPVYEK